MSRHWLMPVSIFFLVILWVGCRPIQGNGRNVLLITYETTRADHLGAYGYERDTSPELDRWAREGALFEVAWASSPRTNPSLASLMTSRLPHEHGVRNLLLPLEPENRTLAEVLRAAGYQTGAVQTHPRLVRGSGLEQGFGDYLDDYRSHPIADAACRAAEGWIRSRAGGRRPWMMWLHLMDPHWTYDPPEGWRDRFAPADPRPRRLYRALAERSTTIGPVIFENTMPADEIEAFVDHYDAEIAFTDRAVGGLLDRLRTDGLLDGTVVAVTADHGESLGEHDYYFEHGSLGGRAELHVPMILIGPDVPAVRLAQSVPTLDLGPTLLDLVGVSAAGAFRGRSLMPLVRGEEDEHRACLGETGKKFHEQNPFREIEGIAGKRRWLRRGAYRLIHVPGQDGSFRRLLYDLDQDPDETRDIAADRPELAARLGRELDAFLAEDPGGERRYHISPEAEEVLRSLGYIN